MNSKIKVDKFVIVAFSCSAWSALWPCRQKLMTIFKVSVYVRAYEVDKMRTSIGWIRLGM
mgnify:CR=1 FL=1